MKKIVSVTALAAGLISAFAASAASADGARHFGHGPAVYRPAYVSPAPVRYVGHNYSRGYWHNGRWIAPVIIGGVALAAASSYYYNTAYVAPTTYYAPAPVATVNYSTPYYASPVSVNYAAPVADAFSAADTNGDGVLSYQEAAVYPHWQRNFGTIDRNRDGFLTRDEVGGWRTH